MSVHADDREWARKARSIMDGFGGHDIDTAREAHAKGPMMERHREVKR